jgi:hypothetical protein
LKTLGSHISNIRGLVKIYTRTQEGYTDEGLYNLFSICRNEVLSNQLKKFHALSEDNWKQICMGLEITKSHNCDCVPDYLECKVLKSKYKIPTTLVGRNNSKIKIRTIGGKVINLVSEGEWFRKKDTETKDYYGSIVNSYLVIWNAPLALKVILISGIWSNPLELATLPNCSEEGTEGGVCYNPMTEPFPLQEEYTKSVYEMVIKLLSTPMQIPQDQTNDSNEFIKM